MVTTGYVRGIFLKEGRIEVHSPGRRVGRKLPDKGNVLPFTVIVQTRSAPEKQHCPLFMQ